MNKFYKLATSLTLVVTPLIQYGCSTADLNKSFANFAPQNEKPPKPILTSKSFDKKDYSSFAGKWSLGNHNEKNENRRYIMHFNFPNNGDGYGTVETSEEKLSCSGIARANITSSNTFELSHGKLACNDNFERNVAGFKCTVNDNGIEATCLHSCINDKTLAMATCQKSFRKVK